MELRKGQTYPTAVDERFATSRTAIGLSQHPWVGGAAGRDGWGVLTLVSHSAEIPRWENGPRSDKHGEMFGEKIHIPRPIPSTGISIARRAGDRRWRCHSPGEQTTLSMRSIIQI